MKTEPHEGTADVLAPQFAGSWYDSNPEQLARGIDADIPPALSPVAGAVQALILPHAGYQFSGSIAAHGAAQLRGRQVKRVIVLAPSHRMALPRQVAMPDADAMETPLGRIPIDRGSLTELAGNDGFITCSAAFQGEHSIEIQLPILQRVLVGQFSLTPLIVGQLDAGSALRIARRLLSLVDQDTVVVVSSDFTHYGKGFGYVPFGEPIAGNIRQLDDGAFACIAQHDSAGFLDYCDRTGATICGRNPIAILLAMLPHDAEAHRIAYNTSGHLTGDFSHCVSYLAAAFILPSGWPEGRSTASIAAPPASPPLSADDKRLLLSLARRAIDYQLDRRGPPVLSDLTVSPTPAVMAHRGAFVTLYGPGHRLRGCIGEIIPQRPLVEAVADNAIQSAFHDPRFAPLNAMEWSDVTIEISALTAPRRVESIEEIEIGRHGVIFEKNGRSSVFLPQVAVEQGWQREQTLSNLARKAGLPADAWRNDAVFNVFEADVFNESK